MSRGYLIGGNKMALKISKNVGLTDVITSANPLATQHINTGEAKQVLVYLFNDAATKKYEGVSITGFDSATPNEAAWLNFAPDNAGVAGTFSATLSMANISDANTAKPFWVRVTNTSGTESLNKTDLNIRVTATEFAV